MSINRLAQAFRITFASFLLLLPIHTIWIYRDLSLGGAKWEYGTLGYYGTEFLLWLSVFIFLKWFWRKKEDQMLMHEFRWTKDRAFVASIAVFLGYTFLSSLWAFDGELARQQALRLLEGAMVFFLLLLGPLKKEKALFWFVGGAVATALFGMVQFALQSTWASTLFGLSAHPVWEAGTSIVGTEAGRWLRGYGTFSHPNIFGGYLVVAVLLLLWRRLRLPDSKQISPPKADPPREEDFRFQIFDYVCVIVLTTGIFVSFSRSAWIAGFMGLMVYGLYCFKNKLVNKQYFLIFFNILVLSIVFFPLVHARIAGESAYEIRSVDERVSGYHEAVSIIGQHPLIGVGIGNYTAVLIAQDNTHQGWYYQPVHNVFLLFFAELGVVGLLFVLCSLFLVSKTFPHIKQYAYYFLPLLPLLFFDHYLWSSYVGVMMIGVYGGFVILYSEEHYVIARSGAATKQSTGRY